MLLIYLYRKDFTSPADETQCCETETGADSGDTQGQPRTEQFSAREATASNQMISGRPDLKRKRAYDKGRDDADDERNQKRPRRGQYQPKDLDNTLKFACPYRKYNPNKYSVCNRPKCALTALETVARVKYGTLSDLFHILSNNIKGPIYIETTAYSHVTDASSISTIMRR